MSKIITIPEWSDGFFMNVHVVLKDINNGVQNNCKTCPNALAIKRRLAAGTKVLVSNDTVAMYPRGQLTIRYAAKIPKRIDSWILKFDRTGYGDPVRYQLEFVRTR